MQISNKIIGTLTRNQYRHTPGMLFKLTIDTKGYVDHRSELLISHHPDIPKRAPYKVELKHGETYFWCSCGKSQNQPFCDGSHKSTCYKPLKFTYTEETKVRSVCGCKLNKEEKGPFCDGSHKKIDYDQLQSKEPGFIRSKEWLEQIKTQSKK